MEIGDYYRTRYGISQLIEGKCVLNEIIKSSPNILELLEPMDLMYVDIDNGYEEGIIVPRIAETQNELDEYIAKIKNGTWILSGVVTREQLERGVYWL